MQIHAFETIRSEWSRRSQGPLARRTYMRLVNADPLLAQLDSDSLSSVFEHAQGRRRTDPILRWEVTRALIEAFDVDEIIGIGLVSMLVPGLARLGERLSWGRGSGWSDADSFASDLVATTWSVLSELAGSAPEYPERIVLDRVRGRLRHQMAMEWKRAKRVTSLVRGPIGAEEREWELPDETPLSNLEQLTFALGRAIHEDIDPEDIKIVFAHRVLGYTFSEISSQLQRPASTLKFRSNRAETLMSAG